MPVSLFYVDNLIIVISQGSFVSLLNLMFSVSLCLGQSWLGGVQSTQGRGWRDTQCQILKAFVSYTIELGLHLGANRESVNAI